MVRTQLYLDELLHKRLKIAAAAQGRTVSELVREAVTRVYGAAERQERMTTLEGITSLWRNRRDIGDSREYVRRLRCDTRGSRRTN